MQKGSRVSKEKKPRRPAVPKAPKREKTDAEINAEFARERDMAAEADLRSAIKRGFKKEAIVNMKIDPAKKKRFLQIYEEEKPSKSIFGKLSGKKKE